MGAEKPVWGGSEHDHHGPAGSELLFLLLTHPTVVTTWSHRQHVCAESRSRVRLYDRNPCTLQQTFGSGVQPDGVGRDSVGMVDKEEEQGRLGRDRRQADWSWAGI